MFDIDQLIGDLIDAKEQRESGVLDDKRPRGSYARSVPQNATCGNCSSMSYSGIHEVTRYSGTCDEYKLSERFVNKPCDAACPFWRRRSYLKMQAEDVYSREVIVQLQNLNRSIQGRINVNTGKLVKAQRPKILDEKKEQARQNKVDNALSDLGLFDMFGGGANEETSGESE